jgi:hypothetical protein
MRNPGMATDDVADDEARGRAIFEEALARARVVVAEERHAAAVAVVDAAYRDSLDAVTFAEVVDAVAAV